MAEVGHTQVGRKCFKDYKLKSTLNSLEVKDFKLHKGHLKNAGDSWVIQIKLIGFLIDTVMRKSLFSSGPEFTLLL